MHEISIIGIEQPTFFIFIVFTSGRIFKNIKIRKSVDKIVLVRLVDVFVFKFLLPQSKKYKKLSFYVLRRMILKAHQSMPKRIRIVMKIAVELFMIKKHPKERLIQ